MSRRRRRAGRPDLAQLLEREDELTARLLALVRRLARVRASRLRAQRRAEAAAGVAGLERATQAAAAAVTDVTRRSEAASGVVQVEQRADAGSDVVGVGVRSEAAARVVNVEQRDDAVSELDDERRSEVAAAGDIAPLGHACTQCDVGPRAECLWPGRRPPGQRYHAARLRAARGSGGSL